MTETTTAPTSATNDMFATVVAMVTEQTNAANEKATAYANATVDSKSLVHEIRNDPNTTDPEVKAFQEWVEAANAEILARETKIDKSITERLLPTSTGDVDTDALKNEYAELKKAIGAARTFSKNIPGYSDEIFANVPELKTLRGGTSSGGGGGGKRPRLENIWVGNVDGTNMLRVFDTVKDAKTGNEREVSNFTLAARLMADKNHANSGKPNVPDLQKAAFEAAKTDDLSTLAGKVFEFVYSPDEGKHSYRVKVQPKDTDKDAAAEVSEPATTEADATAETAAAE